jgi:hypothetical protein
MDRIAAEPGFAVEDVVGAPLEPGPGVLLDGFFREVTCLSGGLVRGERWRLRLGPLTLFRFGEPRPAPGGWSWPIVGGLLVGRPGGSLAFAWRAGRLWQALEGYRPRLPAPLYRRTQLPLHHAVSRLVLLRLRGPAPSPGIPAGPAQRLAAAAADLALCAGLAALLPRRRLAALGPLAAIYHLAFWSSGGTPGGRLLGQRLVSVDGTPPSAAQAALRLLTLPVAVRRLRALHDELAGTEVTQAGRLPTGQR